MKVAMIDLLAQTPFYDRCLAESVAPLVDQFTLYITRFHYEPEYFDSVSFNWTPVLTDRLGLAFSRLHWLRRPVRLLEYHLNWCALLRRFQSHPPDVVHIQWLPLLGISPVLSEMRFVRNLHAQGLPIVYTVHNYLPHDTAPSVATVYHRLYCSVDHLIVHTESDRQRLLSGGISERRITVIPMGPFFIEQYGFPSLRARELLRIKSDEFVLLMLGVIRPYKGIEETIRALAQLVNEYPNVRLWVVGNAINKKYVLYLQRLAARLGIQEYIEWRIGYVHSSQIGLFYAAADVVLFPYRDVSQSAAFLTAAGLGKCTISTRVGGLAEIVRDGENGLQIDSAEPDAIAEGLRRCLAMTAEQRNAMGLALRDAVNQRCSWAQIAEKTVIVYKQVIGRCTSGAFSR